MLYRFLNFRGMFILLFFMVSTSLYAQSHSDIYAKASDMQVNQKESKYVPSTFGLYGIGYFVTGSSYGIGNGGGIGFNYKTNFNKYFGISSHFNYTYAEYKAYQNQSHLIDAKVLLVLQRETALEEKGFVPWAHLGASFNTAVISAANNLGVITGIGAGFVVGGGLKYNFEKMYVGVSFDYTLAILSGDMQTVYGSATVSGIDPSGIRIYGEIGFRL